MTLSSILAAKCRGLSEGELRTLRCPLLDMDNPSVLLFHIQPEYLLSCTGAQPFGVSEKADIFADCPSKAVRRF